MQHNGLWLTLELLAALALPAYAVYRLAVG